MAIFCGDFEAARSLGVEENTVKEVTGARKTSYGALLLAAYQGRPAEALPLIATVTSDALARGEGLGLHHANWATAILENGLGRYADALPAAEQAVDETYAPFVAACVLPELVEAAVRSGQPRRAAEGLRRLSAMTSIKGADWASGLEARTRALLSEGESADHCYAEAVERLGRTQLRPDLARAHLLYGEWLRRQGRKADARHQLRAAYDTASSPRRRSTSPDWRGTGAPTGKLPRNCSSASAPSNGTSARCSSSWESPRERNSPTRCPSAVGTPLTSRSTDHGASCPSSARTRDLAGAADSADQ
jgi:hypothetical protein